MFQGMVEGVMVLDHTGHILSVNRALTALFPEAGESVGRTPLEATMQPRLQHAAERLLAGSADQGPQRAELELPGGRCLDVNLVPFREPRAGMGLVLVFHDMTEVRRVDKIRRDFTANVSHELRTPLTSIKGYAETLLEIRPPLPDQARQFLEIILRKADHMAAMVQELLALARTEHDRGQGPLEPLDPGPALAGAAQDVAAAAAERGVSLDLRLPDGLPVLADPGSLRQVFRNLLENAVRHSPQGGMVRVGAVRQGQEELFQVTDQGAGVPEAERERIFERFYRLDPQAGGRPGSAGLGLAICRHHVRNMQGRIWVEDSPEPPGARFCFTLKAAPDTQAPPAGDSA